MILHSWILVAIVAGSSAFEREDSDLDSLVSSLTGSSEEEPAMLVAPPPPTISDFVPFVGSDGRMRSKLSTLVESFLEKRDDVLIPGPVPDIDREIVLKSVDEYGFIGLGTLLTTRHFATIFDIGHDSVLLKYQVNCAEIVDPARREGEDSIHPLVKEAVLVGFIREMKIASKILYLSGARKFEQLPLSLKTDFTMPRAYRELCLAHPSSSLRFALVERAPTTLHDVLNGEQKKGLGLRDAVKLTLELLDLLEKLHSKDIVHGNIHTDNVVVEQSSDKSLKLSDFAYAFFNSDNLHKEPLIREPHSFSHPFLSAYNIQGYRSGFRDDLFRALHVLATLMMGSDFVSFIASLNKDALFEFKAEKYYFATPSRDPVLESDSLSLEGKDLVKHHLSEAMEIARNQPFVYQHARIPEVRFHLALALDIIVNHRFSS